MHIDLGFPLSLGNIFNGPFPHAQKGNYVALRLTNLERHPKWNCPEK